MWRRILAGAIVLFGVIQLIPVNRTNPPVVDNVVFADPAAERIARIACYDCHTNDNTWPWYSYVAPVSWVVIDHVNEGRSELNFSDVAGMMTNEESEERGEIAQEAIETIQEGEMPPAYYLLTHPQAKLSAADKATLIAGLQQALGQR
jgi:hypothetical protein